MPKYVMLSLELRLLKICTYVTYFMAQTKIFHVTTVLNELTHGPMEGCGHPKCLYSWGQW